MDPRAPLPRKAIPLTALVLALTVLGFWPGDRVDRRIVPGHGPVEIPRTFDEEGLKDFELPLPGGMIAEHITPEYYYGIPERVIYTTHPMYHPDHEPEGYLDSLRALGPSIALDTDTIDTDEEWIRAGRLVFDAPQNYVALESTDPSGLVPPGTHPGLVYTFFPLWARVTLGDAPPEDPKRGGGG